MSEEAALEPNRANWDERVPGHLQAYEVEGFIADPRHIITTGTGTYLLRATHPATPSTHRCSPPRTVSVPRT